MLTPDQVEDLRRRFVGELRLPLDTGDRIVIPHAELRKAQTTIRRLAVMVTLDRQDGPTLPGLVDETDPPAKPTEG